MMSMLRNYLPFVEGGQTTLTLPDVFGDSDGTERFSRVLTSQNLNANLDHVYGLNLQRDNR